MTLGALARIVAATLAIDAAVEHGPERWAAWQRRREASKRADLDELAREGEWLERNLQPGQLWTRSEHRAHRVSMARKSRPPTERVRGLTLRSG